MYAITCDLDTATPELSYGKDSWRNAHLDVRSTLSSFGFEWQQGSVYFGKGNVDAVTCVLAVQELTRRFSWFKPSVRDIRMLRVEDNTDLAPAIDLAARR